MRRLARHTMPALLLAAALAVLGCTGDSDETTTTSTTASPSATATATATAVPRPSATATPTGTPTTTRSLTTSATGSGRISPLPGAYSYLDGASVTVTATPDEGWRLASWGGDCSAVGATSWACVVTMSADRTASVTFARVPRTLTVTAGGGGTVTHDGAATIYHGDEVTLTAAWDDATHDLGGWGGDCSTVGATASTCVLTMDANKTVTATFTALSATRCAAPAAADCIRAVYRGAPTDYAQVADIPADKLLTADTGGHYYVERGEQYTVVTAARLPAGWTRFYLQRDPAPAFGTLAPVSFSQLIKPVGTTYTFTVSDDDAARARFTFELKEAKPHPVRPGLKPILGDVVVRTIFQAPTFTYNRFDTTGAATAAGSYAFLMPDPDSETVGATTVVTTYEQLRTASTVLRVNVTNADGVSLGGFYDSVEVGDLAQWGKAQDCFVRYRVTSVPDAAATHREFGVRPETYAFQSCQTGAVPTQSYAVRFTVGSELPLEHLSGTSLTDFAVVHGVRQLVPAGVLLPSGVAAPESSVLVEPMQFRALTPLANSVPHVNTGDLGAARALPYWREPRVPEGWAFAGVRSGGYEDGLDGYTAAYIGPEGQLAVLITGAYASGLPMAADASWTVNDGKWLIVNELQVIAGRPATVMYSPLGPEHHAVAYVSVEVYDHSTGAGYIVDGKSGSLGLRGGPEAAARLIAIACSLFWSESECAYP